MGDMKYFVDNFLLRLSDLEGNLLFSALKALPLGPNLS